MRAIEILEKQLQDDKSASADKFWASKSSVRDLLNEYEEMAHVLGLAQSAIEIQSEVIDALKTLIEVHPDRLSGSLGTTPE